MSEGLRHERPWAAAVGISGVLALLLLGPGCGGGPPAPPPGTHIQRVTGKVMMGNGMPMTRGKVVLTPQQDPKEPLTGWIDSDGIYTLMEGQGLAIPHGEFLVHIEPPAVPKDAAKTPQAQAVLARMQKAAHVPAKYQKPETSKLKFTIGPDTKELPTILLK